MAKGDDEDEDDEESDEGRVKGGGQEGEEGDGGMTESLGSCASFVHSEVCIVHAKVT